MVNRATADTVGERNAAGHALPHVVIVGAGFAGLKAALGLAHAPVRVTVIDRNNHHLFQPLLYQVATAELSPADISAPIRNVLRHQHNTTVLLAEVTGIDVERRTVTLHSRSPEGPSDEELNSQLAPYDYLVLATGASHSYFGHDEWAPFAPGLKSVTDATALRREILLAFEAAEMELDLEIQRALLTFIVVGGGPTGVEMAGAIAELAHKALASDFRRIDPASAQITLVEATNRILPAFPERLARKAHEALQRLGVHVRTNAPVQHVDEGGATIAGEYMPARTVIWAAGVRASQVGQWIGAATDKAGRVPVGDDLTVSGHPEIFVLGDVSSHMQDGKPLPGIAPVALQEGQYVARVIRARASDEPAPGPFRYFDKGYLATVGRTYAIGNIGKLQLWGLPAWLVWGGVHILYLIGFRNRVLVMLQWFWAYVTFQRGARLITLDEQAPLPAKKRSAA
ncbi:MAG: NAD(P)/FAD-dependent oxidoreductase [Ktedonobacterales bacterium]